MNIRVVKNRGYTSISNTPINDTSLSAEALGVIVYLLSKPDNWVAHKSEVANRFAKNTPNKIDTIFKELREAGYAQLVPIKSINESGKTVFIGSEYVFFEEPQTAAVAKKTKTPPPPPPPPLEQKEVKASPFAELYFFDEVFDPEKGNVIQELLEKSEYADEDLSPQKIYHNLNGNTNFSGKKRRGQWESKIITYIDYKRNDGTLQQTYGKKSTPIKTTTNEPKPIIERVGAAFRDFAEQHKDNPLFNPKPHG